MLLRVRYRSDIEPVYFESSETFRQFCLRKFLAHCWRDYTEVINSCLMHINCTAVTRGDLSLTLFIDLVPAEDGVVSLTKQQEFSETLLETMEKSVSQDLAYKDGALLIDDGEYQEYTNRYDNWMKQFNDDCVIVFKNPWEVSKYQDAFNRYVDATLEQRERIGKKIEKLLEEGDKDGEEWKDK